ncbi:MAG: DNA repair protein RecN [Acidobacteria bacterium]|nr:DNA repair protein RecN [Acidobacteriota bacterium]
MLKLLNIANLAVFDKLCIEFQKGLNLLTGETGSGKSIIVDALTILFGDPFSSDKVRTGEDRAWVEGVFLLEGRDDLSRSLESMGLETEDGELILKREWTSGGRVRSFVNHAVAGASALKALRGQLVEIHGQGEEQMLLSSSHHVELLDRFAGLERLAASVADAARTIAGLAKERAELQAGRAERSKAVDLLKFQVDEIDRAGIRAGEDGELEAERRVLAQAEKAERLAGEAHALLYEEDGAVYSQMAAVNRRLNALAQIDREFEPLSEQLGRTQAAIEEIAARLRSFGSGRDFSPERLVQLEERLAELERIKRKYGAGLGEVFAERDRLAAELERLAGAADRLEALEQQVERAVSEYQLAAQRLSRDRKRAAPKLEAAVRRELDHLALRGTQFKAEFKPSAEAHGLRGHEEVEFLIAPNVGEGLRPLARIASGGELSRLMLALRTVISDGLSKCLVFDEVDTGIGGRAAEEVGARLKRLAKSHQVFCVTHQPQIARFADAHYRVEKVIRDGRTSVVVERLDEAGRLQEVSRMLAGSEVTTAARRHAKELLRTH